MTVGPSGEASSVELASRAGAPEGLVRSHVYSNPSGEGSLLQCARDPGLLLLTSALALLLLSRVTETAGFHALLCSMGSPCPRVARHPSAPGGEWTPRCSLCPEPGQQPWGSGQSVSVRSASLPTHQAAKGWERGCSESELSVTLRLQVGITQLVLKFSFTDKGVRVLVCMSTGVCVSFFCEHG